MQPQPLSSSSTSLPQLPPPPPPPSIPPSPALEDEYEDEDEIPVPPESSSSNTSSSDNDIDNDSSHDYPHHAPKKFVVHHGLPNHPPKHHDEENINDQHQHQHPHHHHLPHKKLHHEEEPTPSSISTSPASSHDDMQMGMVPSSSLSSSSPTIHTATATTTSSLAMMEDKLNVLTVVGTTTNSNGNGTSTTTSTTTTSTTTTNTTRSTNTPHAQYNPQQQQQQQQQHHHDPYRTPPLPSSRKTIHSNKNHTTTTTTTTTPSSPKNEYDPNNVDLIELATITMTSTIIASKVIQKYSTQLSSSKSTSTSTTSSTSTSTSTTTSQPQSTRTKNDGSIVTDADGESQRIITSYISTISPHIRIVGEESKEEIQLSQNEYHRKTWWGVSPGSKRKLLDKEKEDEEYIGRVVKEEVRRRIQQQQQQEQEEEEERQEQRKGGVMGMKSRRNMTTSTEGDIIHQEDDHGDKEEEIDIHNVHPKRISIYVDPLDGTGAYAKGQYEAVTILAGIMLDNVPIFGVIVKPFGHEGCNVNFDVLNGQGEDHHSHPPREREEGSIGQQECQNSLSLTSSTTATVSKAQAILNRILSKDICGKDTTTTTTTTTTTAPTSTTPANTTMNESKLGFKYPCSAIYGGTLLGGAFIFSGEELRRSRIHRTNGISMSMPSFSSSSSSSLERKESFSSSKEEGHCISRTPSYSNSNSSIPNEYPSKESQPQERHERKAIISKSRGGGVVKQCITSLSSKGLLHPEPIYITGAGYKTLRLLLGTHNETMWFFPKPGTSLWDVAAADALLRVMGGRLSDRFGMDLDYSVSWTDADNLDGIVACSDVELHRKCIELYHDECWDDED